MCSVCLRTPCAAGCPHAPEPKPVKICVLCHEGIYEGDKFFDSDEGAVCEGCMEEKSYEEILTILGETMKTA